MADHTTVRAAAHRARRRGDARQRVVARPAAWYEPGRMRRRCPAVAALFAALFAILLPRAAAAYEHQWHVGVGFGYSLLAGEDPPDQPDAGPTYHGLGGNLHVTYGLTDAFNAMAQVDFTGYSGGELVVGSASIGAGYVIDILEWVPYVGLMVGGYQLAASFDACDAPGASCGATRLGLSVPIGLDYQISRSFAVGVQGRYHLLLGNEVAHILTAFARAEYIWGY
jgi:hypothetical protein